MVALEAVGDFFVFFDDVADVVLASASIPSSMDWRFALFVAFLSVLTFVSVLLEAIAPADEWVDSRVGDSIEPSSLGERIPGEVGSIRVSASGEP